jgi:hypothetical protein
MTVSRVPIPSKYCVIVAPFYPPSGLPPSHRARLFVRHLPSFGWTPIVVTVDPRDRAEAPEPALEAMVPAGIRTERVRAVPLRLARLLGVGDLALRALPTLALRTARVAREVHAAVIVLIVPPWYGLWMASFVARRSRARVVVDYVDPWHIQRTGTLKSRIAAWLAARTESRSLRGVRGLFAVADPIISDVRTRCPSVRAAPSGSAPYGFEATDWGLIDVTSGLPAPTEAGAICIRYLGAISDSQLPVLTALLDAMARFREQRPVEGNRVRLELYGTTYAAGDRAEARTADLVRARGLDGQVVERPPRVPYAEALRLTIAADANLVLGDQTRYYAASKLMPVLAAQRPILALLDAATEPAALLRRLGARGVVCYGTPDVPSPSAAVPAIVEVLMELVNRRIPTLTVDFAHDPVLAARSAAQMAAALAAVLDRVAAEGAGAA